jgi:hypothetical protein
MIEWSNERRTSSMSWSDGGPHQSESFAPRNYTSFDEVMD